MSSLTNGVVFAGTRGLATRCLLFVIESCGKDHIAGILGASRHEKTWWRDETSEELWEVAERFGIPFYESIDDVPAVGKFLVSVMWNNIFPPHILTRFEGGGINLHPGPLPQYRGSFARTHAILNGEKSFGVTVHFLSERVDRGDIIGELHFPVLPSETALSLDTRAQLYGYALFCQVWLRLLDGSFTRRSQDELIAQDKRKPCFYPMRMMTALLDSSDVPRSAEELDRLYRALYLPPRIEPPKWLVERVLTNEVRTLTRGA
ncbi:formyltransferase family protein [Bradyrhizobium yuanmingense]|uniref:formyltransferase family protein n=1 Tax=Bradyrhizobium yuanmingense TaxID=108015 RepID=UPI0023B8982D|nr:formyltransferase family protein [Bradyrhizobium yuanmingense]MDF0584719.1 formyltransferase family protein [Bradyrhizobium yuanmingense]